MQGWLLSLEGSAAVHIRRNLTFPKAFWGFPPLNRLPRGRPGISASGEATAAPIRSVLTHRVRPDRYCGWAAGALFPQKI